MASKLASKIHEAVLSTNADQPYATVAIDTELQEIRDLLEDVIKIPTACSGERGSHSPTCVTIKRARKLLAALQIEKGGG